MKKILTLLLALGILSSSAIPASATRQRATEQAANEVITEETKPVDGKTEVFVENLPAKPSKSNSAYDGYHYNGVPITVPDFSRFEDRTPEEITSMSDAIRDYLGWDILLGTSDYVDSEDYFYFKPIEGLGSATNSVFGYGRKKFGEGELKFKMKVKHPNGKFDAGWIGLCFRATSTQAFAWSGNPQYLLIIKPDMIEMQKWFNSQQMLTTPAVTDVIKHDTWQEVSIVTKNLEQGVQIILTVDGVEYLNVMDTEAPFAPLDGYFMLHNSGFSEIQLAPVDGVSSSPSTDTGSTDEETPSTTSLNVTLEKANMTVDNENQAIPEIYFENGSAMIPLRAVSNVLGGFISWDSQTSTATVSTAGKTLQFTNTYSEYVLNGEHYLANAKSAIKDGNLYVPADVLVKIFNADLKVEGEKVYFTGK